MLWHMLSLEVLTPLDRKEPDRWPFPIDHQICRCMLGCPWPALSAHPLWMANAMTDANKKNRMLPMQGESRALHGECGRESRRVWKKEKIVH